MSRFAEIAEKLYEDAVDVAGRFEHFLSPLAHTAINAGLADIMTDASQVAVQVMADPTIVTNSAKRSAVAAALEARIIAQGKTLGDNEIHAFAAAALAQTPVPVKIQEEAVPEKVADAPAQVSDPAAQASGGTEASAGAAVDPAPIPPVSGAV